MPIWLRIGVRVIIVIAGGAFGAVVGLTVGALASWLLWPQEQVLTAIGNMGGAAIGAVTGAVLGYRLRMGGASPLRRKRE